MEQRPVHRVLNLVPDDSQHVRNMSIEEARSRLFAEDPSALEGIEGSWALVARKAERVRMARSLDRPLRYFLAKEADGPMLVVAERMDEIARVLEERGYADQFHPTYTRMVPAHHLTELRLVGCPDPNPTHERFFDPPRGVLPPDPERIGRTYVEALRAEIAGWLEELDPAEPVGVPFSGGLDSGTVLLVLHDELLARGEAPTRLKAFTLAVGDGGEDLEQARRFLRLTGLEMLGEEIQADVDRLRPLEAVPVVEDYKPLDVQCAAVNLLLMDGIRRRYPDWRYLMDGDGGDENLKDYPIEENDELTIRSVVGNPMLYQEGWGVDAVKHSLTYSGGLSRGCVRSFAPARAFGFTRFSPFMAPRVVRVAEAIPFDEVTGGSHEALYGLKGEILRRGVRQVLDRELPVFPKRRFQRGAVPPSTFRERLDVSERTLRSHFLGLHAGT